MNARKLTKLVPALAVGAVAVAAAEPALAHHPLGGAPMETFAHGVLSGIGHPLLGFDHLFFVLAVGLAALYTGHRFTAPAAYIVAMLAGCLMMSLGVGLPAKEIVIGLSLLALGAVVLSGRAMSILPAVIVFHGSAFGDSMAAQVAGFGAPVLVGYLLGLGVLQYAIAVAAGTVALKLWKATESTAMETRLAGAVVAGVGMFLTLENLEGIVLGAIL